MWVYVEKYTTLHVWWFTHRAVELDAGDSSVTAHQSAFTLTVTYTHTNIKTPYALINTHIARSASHLENAGGLGGTEEPLDSELIPDLHNTTRKF